MALRRTWHLDDAEPAPTHRLEALADGVFAIVMTLLVLELGVPVVSEASSGEVGEALREMWPEFLAYVLSFLVLGLFWLMHKATFDSIVAADPPLVWINVAFLMVVALLPFSTALVGEYRDMTAVALVYGLNLVLAFATAWAIWAYATKGHRLTPDDLDPVLVRGGSRMGFIYVLVMVGATALAFVHPLAAYAAYGAVVVIMMILTMAGSWEAAFIWARDRDLGS